MVAKVGSSDTAEESLKMSDPDVSWGPLMQRFDDPKSTPQQRLAIIRVVMAKANYRRPLPQPIAAAVASDPDAGVRRAALRAILDFQDPSNRMYLDDALAKETDPQLKAELKKAVDEEWEQQSLKWYRERLTGDSVKKDFIAAIRALGTSGKPEEAASLEAIWEGHHESEARYEIIIALGRLGGPEAIGFVRQALEDDDPYVRAAAAAVESTLKDPAAIAALEKMLAEDNIGDCRISAARALVAIGGDKARDAIAQGCKGEAPSPMVKLACKNAMRDLVAKAPPKH